MTGAETLIRCPWAKGEPETAYHDLEWGTPLHDDRKLFELFVLEGAQAGLSWSTILRKRDNYRRAFADFDPVKMAKYRERQIERLLGDSGIVRNRQKIAAAIQNAKAFLEVKSEAGSFDAYLWSFVNGRPIQNAWTSTRQVPARTPESDAMSKDLVKRGFRFAGPTICYAFMQAAGLVNDHLVDCFRYREVGGAGARSGG
jgi:DNA-3-methyladenine glycosylase I